MIAHICYTTFMKSCFKTKNYAHVISFLKILRPRNLVMYISNTQKKILDVLHRFIDKRGESVEGVNKAKR